MTENNNKNSHLRHIAVDGFKSIKNLDLDMSPINILIGANGAGKSNFISLFTFLSQLSQGKLNAYVQQQGFANTFFHFGAKNTSEIKIDLDVAHNGYHAVLSHSANDDSLVFQQEYCTFTGSPRQWKIKGVLGESGLVPGSEASSQHVRQYTREYLEGCRVYHFHDTSASAGFKQANELHASDYLYKDAKNIGPYLFRLKQNYPDSYRNIIAAIQTVTPFFHDFYLEPRGKEGSEKLLLKWLHREHDEPFSANQLSDGTARFMCLAVLFLQPQELRPNTIILDEPELGLHPAALGVLAEMVKSIAKENQVICSTQSVSFANFFAPEDFIVVDQNKGVSSFTRLKAENFESWLEDYGMGDLWNKNLIGGRPEW